jgi:hypothetical protein
MVKAVVKTAARSSLKSAAPRVNYGGVAAAAGGSVGGSSSRTAYDDWFTFPVDAPHTVDFVRQKTAAKKLLQGGRDVFKKSYSAIAASAPNRTDSHALVAAAAAAVWLYCCKSMGRFEQYW